MRSKELLAHAAQGVEPDPSAGAERLAAVSLAKRPSRHRGLTAMRAAPPHARSSPPSRSPEGEDTLRLLLTPDPQVDELTWTVACYQIGDLTPSALRDFPDPVEAVATPAACPEDSHVAAELVVSASTGLRWTALTRTNSVVTFQLPTTDTASDGSGEHPGDLAVALRRWREQVARWDEAGDGSDGAAERARARDLAGAGPLDAAQRVRRAAHRASSGAHRPRPR